MEQKNVGQGLRNNKRGLGRSDDPEASEPVVKKSTFKLQPATLIHGLSKAAPKTNQNEQNKCKFLQPSKLQPPSSSSASSAAASRFSDFSSSSSKPSSNNPFLKYESEDESSPQKNKKSSEEKAAAAENKNDNNKSSSPVAASSAVNNPTPPTQPLSTSNQPSTAAAAGPKQPPAALEQKPSSFAALAANKSKDDNSKPSFVFGQNLAERAKVEESNGEEKKSELVSFSTVEKTSSGDENNSKSQHKDGGSSDQQHMASSGGSCRKLEENAAEHFAASQAKVIAPAVDVITGEEDEKSVLQVQCKLYQYDQKTTTWKERGVGSLHLNDCKLNDRDSLQFQSRLVMRVNGSMRVVLNTKVWPQMSVDRASQKSIRISAQTESADIGVYLISGSQNDIEQVYRAIEYRVLHLRQVESKQQKEQKQNGSESTTTATPTSESKQATGDSTEDSATAADKTSSADKTTPSSGEENDAKTN